MRAGVGRTVYLNAAPVAHSGPGVSRLQLLGAMYHTCLPPRLLKSAAVCAVHGDVLGSRLQAERNTQPWAVSKTPVAAYQKSTAESAMCHQRIMKAVTTLRS